MPSCSVLFHKPGFGLDEAKVLLGERGLLVESYRRGLTLKWHDGLSLRLYFDRSENVRREVGEIAEGTPYQEALGSFDTRFEIVFDDLEEVLDEANTLIEVQIALQNATGGFLFNSWNGQLIAPDE